MYFPPLLSRRGPGRGGPLYRAFSSIVQAHFRSEMKVIGLTGGIGMGKSTCAELLRQRAVPVVDTDDLARQVVEPGKPAQDEIRAAFGPRMIAADGQVRRD